MKNEKYYIGFDIGTDSVGYAVTKEDYSLCKFKGEPMWGVTLFDKAELAAARRGFRSARRRLDRRQQRVRLIQELFAEEINKIDPTFYQRIKDSYLYVTDEDHKIRLFGSFAEQQAYARDYPTIHHLIDDLMTSTEKHDVRLLYVACSWLVAHRGHFLNEVDKHSVDKVTDFSTVYQKLVDFLKRDEEYALPWSEEIDIARIGEALKIKQGITVKSKMLSEAFFGGKAPKCINEQFKYNYESVVKLLCGGKCKLKDIFGKEAYIELEETSIALNMDDVQIAVIMQSIDEDDAEFISVLKAVYDWSVLADILNGHSSISSAKAAIYQQHGEDLKTLKKFVKKYIPQKYNELFRATDRPNNYVAYIGKNVTAAERITVQKSVSRENLCKYISSLLKSVSPDETDTETFDQMMERLRNSDFLPKQVEGDNRIIPYQLYWYELNTILENAKAYLPFLTETDGDDGISVAEKILSVFEFRVPYYVGPLTEKSNSKSNHWVIRQKGTIYPWNFETMVDLDKSEDRFIEQMTNSCTYIPGEDVLPKNSLIYCAFEVLNEINNIKINGNEIPVEVKQGIYENVFMRHIRVTTKHIQNYLVSRGYMNTGDVISGLDITIKSSLKPFLQFNNLIQCGNLTYADVETIINRAAHSQEKARFAKWLDQQYSHLSESDRKYIVGLNFKGFGRLSKRFLCGIEGAVNLQTGEYMSVIRTMWETNYNLMQLLTDRFGFKQKIECIAKEYYGANHKSLSERLDDMYVSNAVKRPIIRTMDILKDIVKVQGHAPERIFIEMARGTNEDQKGKRSKTRYEQILELYRRVEKEEDGSALTKQLEEDVSALTKQLEELGNTVHAKLQSKKLFLYFRQFGRCLYTGRSIDIHSLLNGDGTYNIEHIYPQSFVKDDSIMNNEILVDSKVNGGKSDTYPIDPAIQGKMRPYWDCLKKCNALSEEKYKRLIRTTHFTDEERFEFANRQLVETRQSTKVIATLLKEMYPDTEIIYVKAGVVSDFRKAFELLKSRTVNDLHHAKDAYLNIVVGNVWHSKFSRQFWRAEADNNVKLDTVFTHSVICQGKTIWNGAADKDRIVKIASQNTPHVTIYSYCKHSGQNGGFFDQNPRKAANGLIPLKKDRPTEIYGGYNSATVAGFFLVKYKEGKHTQISFVPLKLLDMDKVMADDTGALQYVSSELGNKATAIEILFNKRVIKAHTMIALDGARYSIRGKSGVSQLGLMNMMPFMTSSENERYIKKLESFYEKHKQNDKFAWDETHDMISAEKNKALYDHYIQKLSAWPYNTRPGNEKFVNDLSSHSVAFEVLDIFNQVTVLLQIQGVLGRMEKADLKCLTGSSNAGTTQLSMNLSNWKKYYTDVRIIDQSASGLYEKASENLLDLL